MDRVNIDSISYSLFAPFALFKIYDNLMMLKYTLLCFNHFKAFNLYFTTRRGGGSVKESALPTIPCDCLMEIPCES